MSHRVTPVAVVASEESPYIRLFFTPALCDCREQPTKPIMDMLIVHVFCDDKERSISGEGMSIL
ncbi:hypothetical protein KTH_15110 [Thermosporothrix hazakensis]|nr:hypothetical protein KTC_32070 [Thermosporothrix sp. COM3]GCE46642.1 hypothetical protein KTH_15110 [Thermosporothrix hazakensis]